MISAQLKKATSKDLVKGVGMNPLLHTGTEGVHERRCAFQDVRHIEWQRNLPVAWQPFVVEPVRVEIFQEYEISADRTLGYDRNHEPCYCAFRFVLTALKSDDGEFFYEAPDHAETLTAWCLRDGRWLVYREVVDHFEQGDVHSFFSFSDTMPR
jgi:hypothetical protein